MEVIRAGTRIDFLRYSKVAAIASLTVLVVGGLALWWHGGLNYGVDFAGGTTVHIKVLRQVEVGTIRQALADTDIVDPSVQDFGRSGDEFRLLGAGKGV